MLAEPGAQFWILHLPPMPKRLVSQHFEKPIEPPRVRREAREQTGEQLYGDLRSACLTNPPEALSQAIERTYLPIIGERSVQRIDGQAARGHEIQEHIHGLKPQGAGP